MSVGEQEGTTPRLNRIKTSQFTYRFRKLEEKLEEQQHSNNMKCSYGQCWRELLLKVIHYSIALLNKKVTNCITFSHQG